MLNSPETVTRLQPHFQVDWSPESGIRDTHEWVNKEDPDKGGTVGSVLSPGHLRISNVFVSPHVHEPKIGPFFPRPINNKGAWETNTTKTAAKTSLGTWIRAVSNFIATILPCSICQMWVIFLEIILNDFIQDQKQEKENRCLAFTSSITRVIRKFQVVVVQGRQRNV